MKRVLREIFSGANGKLSAKRVIGGVAMLVALICTTVLVFRDGSNNVVENLLMTIFITSVSLLGLPAVTGIWGSNKVNVGNAAEEPEQDTEATVITEPVKQETPNCETCKYKNRHHRK